MIDDFKDDNGKIDCDAYNKYQRERHDKEVADGKWTAHEYDDYWAEIIEQAIL